MVRFTSSGQSCTYSCNPQPGICGNIVTSGLQAMVQLRCQQHLRRLGIDVRFVHDPTWDEWRFLPMKILLPSYGETIPNPKGDIFDIEKIAQATAHLLAFR